MEKNNKMYLSFSKISTYLKCPMRYKFIYIDELPTYPRSYFSFGNSLHEVLEEFYREDVRKKEIKSPYLYLIELLDKNWHSEGYSNLAEEKRAKIEARRILTKFYRTEFFNYKPAIAVEKEFSFDFYGIEVKGRIDRIDGDYNSIRVIDYKTTSLLPRFFKEEDFLQLLIYKMAASNIYFGRKIEKVTFHFLRHNEKIDFIISDLLLEKGKRKMSEVLQEITKCNFFPKKNGYCNQCEFKNICPAFSKGDEK